MKYNYVQIAGLDTCSDSRNANCKIMHTNTPIKGKKYFLQKKTDKTFTYSRGFGSGPITDEEKEKQYNYYSTTFDNEYKNVEGLYEYKSGNYSETKNHTFIKINKFLTHYYGEEVEIKLSMFDIIAADENTQAIKVNGKKGGSRKAKSRRTRRTRKTRRTRRTRK